MAHDELAFVSMLGTSDMKTAESELKRALPLDPSARRVVDAAASQSLSRNNPWHGRSLPGVVVATVLRGRVTARDGRAIELEEIR